MEWQSPVIDRSEQDILDGTDKAFLNASDIARIDGNTQFLLDKLLLYGYTPSSLISSTWTIASYLFIETFNGFIRSINTMKSLYVAKQSTPALVEKVTTYKPVYTDINEIEVNQLDLHDNIVDMENSFRKAGTFKSGQPILLKVRR